MSLKTKTIIVAAAVTAVVTGAACILLLHRHGRSNDSAAEPNIAPAATFYGVTVELSRGERSCDTVVMGVMHEGERVVRKIRFVNRTGEPLTLIDYRSSCGCTAITLPRRAIAPGSYADADCSFDSRGEYGEQLNVVEIATSDAGTEAILLVESEVE